MNFNPTWINEQFDASLSSWKTSHKESLPEDVSAMVESTRAHLLQLSSKLLPVDGDSDEVKKEKETNRQILMDIGKPIGYNGFMSSDDPNVQMLKMFLPMLGMGSQSVPQSPVPIDGKKPRMRPAYSG
jgi:hypothetical protein